MRGNAEIYFTETVEKDRDEQVLVDTIKNMHGEKENLQMKFYAKDTEDLRKENDTLVRRIQVLNINHGIKFQVRT